MGPFKREVGDWWMDIFCFNNFNMTWLYFLPWIKNPATVVPYGIIYIKTTSVVTIYFGYGIRFTPSEILSAEYVPHLPLECEAVSDLLLLICLVSAFCSLVVLLSTDII